MVRVVAANVEVHNQTVCVRRAADVMAPLKHGFKRAANWLEDYQFILYFLFDVVDRRGNRFNGRFNGRFGGRFDRI